MIINFKLFETLLNPNSLIGYTANLINHPIALYDGRGVKNSYLSGKEKGKNIIIKYIRVYNNLVLISQSGISYYDIKDFKISKPPEVERLYREDDPYGEENWDI